MTLRRLALALGAALLAAVAWLLLAPVGFEPVLWQPEEDPMGTGPWQPNSKLSGVTRLSLDGATGPEDIEVLPDGTLLTGVADGRILRWRDGILDTVADTGGRPLGLVRSVQGGLWVADAERGLLHVAHDGSITVAATEADGLPFAFTDDVDIAPDGWVYFTDADHRWGHHQLKSAALEGGAYGRLLRYRPTDGQVETVMDGLHFANGVAVSGDGTYLLLTETLRSRVLKVFLTPERFGQHEVVIDNLPGYPDNITNAGRGVYWVALFGPRSDIKDAAASSALLRKVAARAPGTLLTRTRRRSMAVAISHVGRVLQFMDDPGGNYAPVTSVTEFGGTLYLGSLKEPDIGQATAPLRLR